MPEHFTYAVVGHDEAPTLRHALDQALAAVRPGDMVWFADSASTDQSVSIARSAGVEVIQAPLGKGRAVQAVLDRWHEGVLCLVDADIEYSEHNIPLRLRDAMDRGGLDLVVGEYDEQERRRVVTPAIFRPLVAALFPEVAAFGLRNPLSGFRALRAGMQVGPLPTGYGVETHLDIQVALLGGRVGSCELGRFQGPLRGYANIPRMAEEVAEAVLDLGVAHGRLEREARPAWDAWVGDVLALVCTQPPPGADDDTFVSRLAELASRPLPAPGRTARSQVPDLATEVGRAPHTR